MFSSLRPFCAGLLCGVLLLGHLPAWLHVATCDSGGPSAAGHHVHGLAGDSGGCGHHHVHSSTESGETRGSAASERVLFGCGIQPVGSHDHDSDHCAICQSLAAPVGFNSALDAAFLSEALVEPLWPLAGNVFVPASLSIAQPRGPPQAV